MLALTGVVFCFFFFLPCITYAQKQEVKSKELQFTGKIIEITGKYVFVEKIRPDRVVIRNHYKIVAQTIILPDNLKPGDTVVVYFKRRNRGKRTRSMLVAEKIDFGDGLRKEPLTKQVEKKLY